jgi:CHAT domain
VHKKGTRDCRKNQEIIKMAGGANCNRINALAVLNHDIAESHSKASGNKSLCESYRDTGSNKWKKEITEDFTNHIRWIPDTYSRWIRIEEIYAEYIYETNLAVWRAIGNEAIDRTFCQAPRSKAKVLALLYYYFEGEQQKQIFDELLETIEEIPARSCKARSYVALVLHLPDSAAIKIIERTIFVVKEIYEDIINSDLRLELDENIQAQEISLYTEIQNGYIEIQRLENQLHTLKISDLKRDLFKLIEITDLFLFPYPRWWEPKMIEGLPPTAIPKIEVEIPSRYADFTFYDDTNDKRVEAGHALQAGKLYQLEVAVRQQPTGIPPGMEWRHSIREPKQVEPVTIFITATGNNNFEIENPVQTLILPPSGDSKIHATFRIRPHKQSANSNLDAIAIRAYYKFNLLEESIIKAEIVDDFDDPSKSKFGLENPILFIQRLEREYVDFDEIESRGMNVNIKKENNQFVLQFTFHNNSKQKVELTAPIYLPALDLEDALLTIRQIWFDIAMSKNFTEGLEGDKYEFPKNINKLAKEGRKLWRKLFPSDNSSLDQIGKFLQENPLKTGSIVQVSLEKNAQDFIFPWALIYDKKLPITGLENEIPDPEGFWGMRYCIEQQPPRSSNQKKGTDKPIDIGNKLKLGFMLHERFPNAKQQKTLMESWMNQSLNKLEITPPITNTTKCLKLLNDCDSHILYFYTHGYTRRHRQADIGVIHKLESFTSRYEKLCGDDPRREHYKLFYESFKNDDFQADRSWIKLTHGTLFLDEMDDAIEGNFSTNPLVFLNMCESAQITPSLSDSFIKFFLDKGSRGVIGTECPMTIEFSHPFSEKFLGDLLAGEKVGNALLNARQYFMQLKNPLGLAYTLFGSATTCFEPASLERSTNN